MNMYNEYSKIMSAINSKPMGEDLKDAIDDLLWFDLVCEGEPDREDVNNWTPGPFVQLLIAMREGKPFEYVPEGMVEEMAAEQPKRLVKTSASDVDGAVFYEVRN